MRRTKIVATLGPATTAPGVLDRLVRAGLDIARLNFSHGSHADHLANITAVRAAATIAQRPVAILADLQGPKIRVGTFIGGRVTLEPGAEFTITTDPVMGTHECVCTTYETLHTDVKPGDEILLDDGRLRLRVTRIDGHRVVTTVEIGGVLSNHKGMNLPGSVLSTPCLTDKDIGDLIFALAHGVDMIAVSFVRAASDADDARKAMRAAGRIVPVIAKIERPEAVLNLDAIIEAFDGVMVARGDLGVELPLEDVPAIQRRVIRMARRKAKPVVVATQMLESMITAERPTRAEVSDVANAVLNGADALMLSGETSVGAYPVESVATMARIITTTEASGEVVDPSAKSDQSTPTEAVTFAALELANSVCSDIIAVFTTTGSSARSVAAHRPSQRIIAFTTSIDVQHQLCLAWGVEAFVVDAVSHTDDMIRQVDLALVELQLGTPEEFVVIIAGTPPGVAGSTNMVRLHRVGRPVREG